MQKFAHFRVKSSRRQRPDVTSIFAFDRSEGIETVVSVLFTNTRTRWPHNEQEIFNTARGGAECSIENFEFIVRPASACICEQNTN